MHAGSLQANILKIRKQMAKTVEGKVRFDFELLFQPGVTNRAGARRRVPEQPG